METETTFSHVAPPIFDGDNYQAWAVRMTVHLEALDLWEAIEEDYDVPPLPANPTMAQLKAYKERKTRKSKAKAYLFSAVSSTIFTRIMNLESAKDIWDYLKKEYQGNESTKNMKVLNLIREFEMLKMKETENIKDYSDKLLGIVNKVRLLGKDFSDERIVQKILVTLPEKYESKISSLEESKDLSSISLAELVNALQAQEQRRMIRKEESMEGALQAKAENSGGGKDKKNNNKKKNNKTDNNNKNKDGTYPPCPHCKKTNHPQRKCWWRPDVKCRKCGQIGHMERICKSQQHEEAKASIEQHQEEQLFVATCFTTSNSSSDSWLIDSGCTNHMTNDQELFKELDKTIISKVKIGNGEFISVKGKGTVAIESLTGLKYITDVLYVPDIDQNLLSVGQLIEKGFKVIFEDKWCMIKDAKGRDVFKVKMRAKSFALNLMEDEQIAFSSTVSNAELWHRRLGHFHHVGLLYMQKQNLVKGVPLLEDKLADCVACQYGKQTRRPFPQTAWRAMHKLQLVHTDVGGPQKTPSLNGSKYYIAFIDDYTRFCWIYFLKSKSEVANVFWKYKAWVENQSSCRMQKIRSDNGKEYTNEIFDKFCEEAGIEHQLTTPYTPQQNGVKRDKLDKKAEPGVFIGYSNSSKAYRIFQPQNGKILVSRDVKFMEDRQWNWEESIKMQLPKPAEFEEAEKDDKWIEAMKEELRMIEKNDTWELVDRPQHRKVIGVKWVYRTKLNAYGSVNKYKARLVVKGYSQVFGVDFSETFAPVARLDTIRMLLALTAQKGWKTYQLDVKSAFLNGYLQEEIYVEQPEGFQVKGQEEKVYLLKKALYGLKQAPRAWYSRIDEHLQSLGFVKSPSEATLYVKGTDANLIVVSVYVDDLLVTGSNEKLVKEFKAEMLKVFEMTDLGLMSYFLGMEVKQDHDGVFISQKKYAKEILNKFHMDDCKRTSTPMNQKEKFSKDDGTEKVDESQYRSLIGCLMYLTATRPDIMFSVSLLSRFMHCASEVHLQAAKRIVRYIKGTTNYGIKYSYCQNFKLHGYSDSDWAGSIDDMRSTTGFCFNFGSGIFSWSSKKQDVIAQSTAEAEYVAANATVNQAIWIRKILADLHMKQNEPTQIHVDNQAAIAISNDSVFHGKTKHFKIKLYHLREEQKDGEVKLLYCKTEDQIADVLTKALPKARFETLRGKIGLCSY
ncbi:Retrovirus-related Pol polyprotein from transposon RE1 [Vitis vinifera]|uniref:Retrovirus-related Pol polyprotein from transposon RE1 n=1 Tax=Vitis vinifera TaxID=29760 RepID=A0A438ER93_VITVI|nr:Retrovirus-related Pol polyprotein from transposon RE1 [Vitis vinifera]